MHATRNKALWIIALFGVIGVFVIYPLFTNRSTNNCKAINQERQAFRRYLSEQIVIRGGDPEGELRSIRDSIPDRNC